MRHLLIAAMAVSTWAGCGTLEQTTLAVRAGTFKGLSDSLSGLLSVNGIPGGTMVPGQPAEWAIGLKDAAGTPVTRFDIEHEKPMHLIAVSGDLDNLAHLHPALEGGTFRIGVNRKSSDPDNADAGSAVPKAGNYLIFSEIKPTGRRLEIVRFDLLAQGQARPVTLVPDPVVGGVATRYFKADGTPGRLGDFYRVALTVKVGEHHPGMPLVDFKFNLTHAHQVGSPYTAIKDLENWLGMPGHGILIGAAGAVAGDKVFKHLHSGHHALNGGHSGTGAGPDLTFSVHGDDVPPAGLYKIWGQFKHHGRVVTFPFTINL